jgi:hypothetical protein
VVELFDHLASEMCHANQCNSLVCLASEFIAFARKYLRENPPQLQLMMAGNFGVRLANGVNVSLLSQDELAASQNEMEPIVTTCITGR